MRRGNSKPPKGPVRFNPQVTVGQTYDYDRTPYKESITQEDRKSHEKTFIEKCQDACEGVYECIKSCLPSSGGKMSRKRCKINKRKTKRHRKR